MVRRKKTTGRPGSSHNKKNGGGLKLVVAVLALVMVIGIFFAAHKAPGGENKSFSDIVSEIMPKKAALDKTKQTEVNSQEKAMNPKMDLGEEYVADKQTETKKTKEAGADKEAAKARTGLNGRLAVVVDDCGYDLEPVETLSSLPIDMAFAIIPFKANSLGALKIIKKNNQLPMLHLPMEPMDASAASEGRMVTVAMTKDEVQIYTEEAINSLPGIKGINNHQGSRATSNPTTMKAVLEVANSRGLFFVDSRTIASSVAYKEARQLGVGTGRNSLFLDNSSNVQAIKKQIWAAVDMADKYGSIIVICHARPATAQAWLEIYKEVQASGIKLVPVTNLLI